MIENLEVVQPEKPQNKQTEIQKIIQAWKLTKNIPIEGTESKAWDQVFFARYSKTAKQLLLLFGYEQAVGCIEFISNYMESRDLDYTFETILKRSDLFREQISRGKR